jgi:hypothetical protein
MSEIKMSKSREKISKNVVQNPFQPFHFVFTSIQFTARSEKLILWTGLPIKLGQNYNLKNADPICKRRTWGRECS